MRFLIIAVSVSAMALATGAFAQTTPQSPGGGAWRHRARHGGRPEGTPETGLPSPIPTSLVRLALYLRTGATFALAAPRRVGRTSRHCQPGSFFGEVGSDASGLVAGS